MSLEDQYIEYAGQLSLSILGVSASYLINLSNPVTLLGLVFLPILYGYTAYISKEGFNKASLASLTTIIFGIIGGATAVLVVPYSLGNIMVSVFSGGEQFKDFYGATSLPLLLTGLVIGAALLGYGTYNQNFRHQSVNFAAEKFSDIAKQTVEESGLVEKQKRSRLRLVNSTSRATAVLMAQNIYKNSQPSEQVATAIQRAKEDVPVLVYNRTLQKFNSKDSNVSETVEKMFVDTFSGSRFVLVAPAVAGFIYSLQPLIGILTAIFAKVFAVVCGRTET